MKKLPLVIAGVALFAAGCWVGSRWMAPRPSSVKTGPVVNAATALAAKSPNSAKAAGSAETAIRPFTAGRPFVKGQAREWLIKAYAISRNYGDSGGLPLVEMLQQLMTMDEDCIAEIIASLTDPAFKDVESGTGQLGLAFAVVRLSQLNTAPLLAMLRDPQSGLTRDTVTSIFHRLAMQSEAQAATALDSIDPKYRAHGLDVLLGNLSGKDPLAALALAEKYPNDASPHRKNEILTSLVKQDPQTGMIAAARLTETGKDTGLLRHAIEQWAGKDRSAAEAWAGSYAGTGETLIKGWLLEQKAAADPVAALTEFSALQQSVADQKELARSAAAIAHHLVRKDLPAARQWATGLPPGPIRDEAVPRMVDQWARQDPGAASVWISALPEGKERDNSAKTLAHIITHPDPPGAFEWARTIQDQEMRTKTLKDVVDEWMRQDADAAKAAVETLPPEMRKGLPGSK